jgi:hypothetical protein
MAKRRTEVAHPKLREAVHFVCRKMASEPDNLGAVKLQRILWYFDVRSYVMTGKSVTGAVYIRKEFGPYTGEVSAAVDELVRAGRLHTDRDDYFGNEKAIFVGKGPTDLASFSDKERRWLEEITQDVCENRTAPAISEKSHDGIWRMAAIGEEIPFAATAVSLRSPSNEAIDLARKDLGIAR